MWEVAKGKIAGDSCNLRECWHVFHFISFKTYLKLVFTIVDSKILIHTNYLQEKYT